MQFNTLKNVTQIDMKIVILKLTKNGNEQSGNDSLSNIMFVIFFFYFWDKSSELN